MNDLVKIIIVMNKERAQDLLTSKRISELDSMPQISKGLKECIREFISDNIGYDNPPIAGLSKYNGGPGELKVVGTGVSEYIPTKADTILFELHMPSDMVITVSYEDLLEYSRLFEQAEDPFEVDMYKEEFSTKLKFGYDEDDTEETISFLPFIDLNKCKFFAIIDNSWGLGNFNVPGVEQIKLSNMDMF